MPSLLIRILLCISSYFPLILIFAIQFWFQGRRATSLIALGVGLLGLLGLLAYLAFAKRLNPVGVTVESVNRKDGEAMSYIVSYLLPFMALPSGELADTLSLAVFLVVLGALYVNSDMMHINPMLNLIGWHIYDLTLTDGEARSLISRRRVRRGHKLQAILMSDDIFLETDR